MILVVNAGSSNTKFAIYETESLKEITRSQVNNVKEVFAWLQERKADYTITSIGHRIVHGGSEFFAPVLLTETVILALKKLIPLAPLHQPHNLAAIEFFREEYPDLPQIGCFDTAFHRTQSRLAQQFAIPDTLTNEGIIRYGFHGLSYEYIASVLEKQIGTRAKGRVVVAHLGNGASMCAMQALRSVATTMGFSALDGLMMGSRCGSIDPGVLLYLLQEKKYDAEKLVKFLYYECGLLGVSNISNDMKKLIDSQEKSAQNAIDLFCYKAATELGKLLVNLGGCDAIIFTGGIGERAALVREKICAWLKWLGVKIDLASNNVNAHTISTEDSMVIVGVIPTDEEFIIAKHVKNLVKK